MFSSGSDGIEAMKSVTAVRIGLVATGVEALAIAAAAPAFRVVALPIALICLFVAATGMSQAGGLSSALQPLRGRLVSIEAWGTPLPGAGDTPLRVQSIRGFGAGLLLWLQPPAGRPTLLKVAQPGPLVHREGRMEIPGAAYVQWAGAKVRRRDGVAAIKLSVCDEDQP